MEEMFPLVSGKKWENVPIFGGTWEEIVECSHIGTEVEEMGKTFPYSAATHAAAGAYGPEGEAALSGMQPQAPRRRRLRMPEAYLSGMSVVVIKELKA